MAELLTHVLVPAVVLTVAGWRVDRLEPRGIAVAMGGAILPDLSRVGLVVDPGAVESAVGVPFSFDVLGTLGGVLVVAAIVTVAFDRRLWPRIYGLLVFGGLTHLFVDGLKTWADGSASLWLYPILGSWRPPTPNLYVSSDPLVAATAVAVAAVVLGLDRWRFRRDPAASIWFDP